MNTTSFREHIYSRICRYGLLVSLIIILSNSVIVAQDNKLNLSIGAVPGFTSEDTSLVMNWIRKGDFLERKAPDNTVYLDSALYWYRKSLTLSREKRFIDGIAYSLFRTGITQIKKGEYGLAEQYFRAVIPHCKRLSVYKYLSVEAYGNLGTLYNFQGNYKLAAGYYDSSIKEGIRLKLDTESPQAANTLNNLVVIYFRLDQPQVALQYAEQVEAIAKKKGYKELIARVLTNKGEIYSKLNRDDEAMAYFKESLTISQKNQFIDNEQATWNSLGEFMLKKGKPKEAITYLKRISYLKTPTYPYYTLIFQGYSLGKAYLQLKDYKKAVQELEKAISIAETYNIQDGKMDAHKTLSEIYATTGFYKKALEHQTIYEQLKDSMLNREKARDINELEIKHRTSEKDRELAIRDKELTEKKLNIVQAAALSRKKTTWIWISSLIALLLALIMVLLRYRQINREQQLRQQKEVELLRATMDGEEAERVRVGKELHDGVSGFLSAIKMNLITLRMQRSDIAHEISYTNTLSLADDAADELRKTAHNLVPSNLVKKGLGEAIRGFCERLSHPDRMQLDVQIMGRPFRLNPEKELAIYRIAQELIHNILKHAQASKVLLTISWLEEVLMISIEDNGIGMPTKKESNGIGLDNILKRVQSVHGNLEIDHSEHTGTSMYLYFPLNV